MLNPGSGAGHLDEIMTVQMLTPWQPVNDDPSWGEGWPRLDPRPWPGVSWGLGWGLQEFAGQRAFWHWGDNGGYKAYALGYPDEGAGIVMLSNGRNGDRLWRSLLARLCPGPQPALDWLASLSD
jgi:CubicO group peptidase (beta-lactamase class C family)